MTCPCFDSVLFFIPILCTLLSLLHCLSLCSCARLLPKELKFYWLLFMYYGP
jgi:hypothetical protein